MSITIILKDGSTNSFNSGVEASDWYDKQMLIRQTPDQQQKKVRNKGHKQDKK